MVLETKKLLLREMNTHDHQALFLVLGDPETMRHYPHSFDEQYVKDWIKRNMDRYQKDGFGIFGVTAKYVQLVCFQVSEEYRRQGIGRKLFSMVCEEARQLCADKLYISAHSSKESQAAYRALGCTPAEEINEELAAEEPFDVQMEYRLYGI